MMKYCKWKDLPFQIKFNEVTFKDGHKSIYLDYLTSSSFAIYTKLKFIDNFFKLTEQCVDISTLYIF